MCALCWCMYIARRSTARHLCKIAKLIFYGDYVTTAIAPTLLLLLLLIRCYDCCYAHRTANNSSWHRGTVLRAGNAADTMIVHDRMTASGRKSRARRASWRQSRAFTGVTAITQRSASERVEADLRKLFKPLLMQCHCSDTSSKARTQQC
jgi:hypothetical protein